MRVTINNDRIFLYMALNNITELEFARRCKISSEYARLLTKQKTRNVAGKTLVNICLGTGLKFSNIFTIEESKPYEKVFRKVLLGFFNKNDRLTIS